MDVVWAVLAFAVCGLLAWLGFRIEPHWVSKDGTRFLCNAQLIDERGEPVTRWRETRVMVEPDGELLVDQKRLMRRRSSNWRIAAEAPEPPRKRAVFLLRGHDTTGAPAMLAIRLPAGSRAVHILRPLLAHGR